MTTVLGVENLRFDRARAQQTIRHLLSPFLVVFFAVFASAMFSILTRSPAALATIWPANAVMLGLLIRFPRLANASGWLGGVAGYLLADLITGEDPVRLVLLFAGNLAGIIAGYLLLSRVERRNLKLRDPRSLHHVTAAIMFAAFAAGLVGTIANPLIFEGSSWQGFLFWFATEAVNYVAFLPVLLTLPAPRRRRLRYPLAERRYARPPLNAGMLRKLLPGLSLVVGLLLATVIGGPGALVFTLPGLFWCGLRYSIPVVALLGLLTSCAVLIEVNHDHIRLLEGIGSQAFALSVRLGVALITLTPLYVATVIAERNEIVHNLERLASTDPLTGALNRRAFFHRGERLMRLLARQERQVAVLMLDIDHFKQVNDRHGHAGGDRILQAFTHTIRAQLRDGALLGRFGGEEFAILLPIVAEGDGAIVAERLRAGVGQLRLFDQSGQVLKATISIGVVEAQADATPLTDLTNIADRRLYLAKRNGRNRVEWGERKAVQR
ncbi:sensor domain-containing diguanylate cyclase [Sphingomonas koreensis]|uniref:GGDEF domain-containing protein n=1 Tax=Sphingomonas koreensis TaxID=93064 RepID=UPI000B2EC071|nr:diguanylate cyclase (GGDEF)-like protein [Sphingomonas koreensis]RSU60633.1 sensor domain-containing diguanylate cyclase [Sphingomonas koreensis]RSU69527.1 sensor domain-containing diguanylate cyclase [Sphingomonas koreensis]